MGGPGRAATPAATALPGKAGPAVVELRGVRKVYPGYDQGVEALRGIDLRVAPGDYASIIGKSGSGKSTLLHILGLLDRPTEGEVLVEGRPTGHLRGSDVATFRGKRVGFVFQHYNLIPRFTAVQNVVLPAMLQGERPQDARPRALALLDRVGVAHRADHRGVHLSGGEQQRVAVARALVNDPALVLADEPTGSLDERSSAEVMALLEGLHGEGRTLVFVTHDLRLARRARRVIELRDGRVARDTGA